MSNVYNFIPKDAPLKQLADSPARFKKQLIRFGDWIDPIFPEEVMRIDKVLLETFVRNFKAGIPGRIPLPLTHTDNPEFNTGELVDLVVDGDGTNLSDGLYGIMEIRRADVAQDIVNELIWDVSISWTDNYQDTENGAMYGPTLLHVALVNNPYIKKMGGFTELAERLGQLFGVKQIRMLSTNAHKETAMSKVKNDREFPVSVTYKNGDEEVNVTIEPGQTADVPKEAVEPVEQQVAAATAPPPLASEGSTGDGSGEGGEPTAAGAERTGGGQLSESARLKHIERELAETKAKLLEKEIDDSYVAARDSGKLVPAQETAFKALALAVHGQTRSLSDGKTQNLSEILNDLITKAPKRVSLNEESGTTDDGTNTNDPTKDLPEESKRGLVAMDVSPEDYAKYGANAGVSINNLVKESKNG